MGLVIRDKKKIFKFMNVTFNYTFLHLTLRKWLREEHSVCMWVTLSHTHHYLWAVVWSIVISHCGCAPYGVHR